MASNKKSIAILDHCIACTTCSKVAPLVFSLNSNGTLATVIEQPKTSALFKKSMEALKSCPVSAIGLRHDHT
jgi:ferredoxin